jgi:hypothetical protein
MIKNFNDFLNETKSWNDQDVKKIANQVLKRLGPNPDRDDLEDFLDSFDWNQWNDPEDFEYKIKRELDFQ